MEFEIFNKNEIEDMYEAMAANMTEAQKQIFIEQYGSMAEWKKSFLEQASTAEAQRSFEKVVEWYGSKETALNASRHPGNADIQLAYQNRISAIFQKLADNMDKDVNSFEVRSLIGEYDFVTKQMFQLPDASQMVLELAKTYQENEKIQAVQDSIYGEGATAYIGRAMEAFYNK